MTTPYRRFHPVRYAENQREMDGKQFLFIVGAPHSGLSVPYQLRTSDATQARR